MTAQHQSIFNKNFYPTPIHVLDMMGIDCYNLNVLEPSAGSGNILKYCADQLPKQMQYCELSQDLAQICKPLAKLIKPNFLEVTAEEISHINLIVMNPPFDHADKHMLHAWSIAPDGCEIISLCNTETLEKDWHSRTRKELLNIIEDYGYSQYLGDVFTTAERKTNVEVSLVKLFKPMLENNDYLTGFYMDEEPEVSSTEGIIKYNEIQALVNSYINALKVYDEFEVVNNRMLGCTSLVGLKVAFTYGAVHNKEILTKEEFAKTFQKRCWQHIFNLMDLGKYVTSEVMKDINKFVQMQHNVPFTVKNIYKMFEIIVGTKEQTLNKALVNIVDDFTKHTHENRYAVEGWKTNSGHMLNHKIIVPYGVEYSSSWGHLRVRSSHYTDKIMDLIKVLCNLTATDYNQTTSLSDFLHKNKCQTNTWYSWAFFEIKGFKKGTLHIKFSDKKVWELLNRRYGYLKGMVLPEKL